MANPPGPPGYPPPGYGPPPGAPPGPYGQQPYPPQGPYGQPPGWGPPPPGMGPPKQGGDPPAWIYWGARGFLALGILLAIATAVGGMMSEQLGVDLAMLTAGPLGFGVGATVMSRKGSGTGVGKPLGCGCGAGLLLAVMVIVFFVSIFPSL